MANEWKWISGAFAGYVLLGVASLALSRLPGSATAMLWLPNALLIGLIIRRPPRFAPIYIAIGFAGRALTGTLVGDWWVVNLALATAAMTGVTASWAVIAWHIDRAGAAMTPATAGWVVGATLGGQALSGLVAAAALLSFRGVAFGPAWMGWWVGNVIGAMIVLPIVLSWTRRRWQSLWTLHRGAFLAHLAVGVGVALLAYHVLDRPFVVITVPLAIASWSIGVLGTGIVTGSTLLALVASRLWDGWYGAPGPNGELDAAAFSLYAALAAIVPLLLAIAHDSARRARRRAEDSEAYQRNMLENAPSGLLMTDGVGRIRMVNSRAAEVFGYPREALIGMGIESLIPDRFRDPDDAHRHAAAPGPRRMTTSREVVALRADGSKVPVEIWLNAGSSAGGSGDVLVSVNDISVRKALEDELARAREQVEVTLRSISDGVIAVDRDRRVRFLNVAAEEATGWSHGDAVGRRVDEVLQVFDADTGLPAALPFAAAIRDNRAASSGGARRVDSRNGRSALIEDSVAPMHDAQGEVVGAVVVFRDISRLHAMALEMKRLAQHDALTGLPNRLLLQDRLQHAIALAQREGHRVALMFLDLDGFKGINDTMGHDVGDALLCAVADRLRATLRESDTVSRMGGDEFVVLLHRVESPSHASVLARKLLRAGREPYALDEARLRLSFSIGVAMYPDDGTDAADLLKNADAAMYLAKQAGRNRFALAEESAYLASVLGTEAADQ